MNQSDEISYEVMRTTVLSTFLSFPSSVDKAYAFAWYSRMPAFASSGRESAFRRFHAVGSDDVEKIKQLVEKLESNKQWKSMDFDKLANRLSVTRDTLLKVLRYMAMTGGLSLEATRALAFSSPDCGDLVSFGPGDVKLPS